ncbi:hypothetical protein [Cetobacterium somerae]|uniref:hypothetical protein n=1 Tax=Cetobacterium somerae TaxID=188913 RepID=UPI0038927E01
MKKFNLMMLVGTLLVGSIAYAESEKTFDYEKNLQERQEIDQRNIEAYSKKMEFPFKKLHRNIMKNYKMNLKIMMN